MNQSKQMVQIVYKALNEKKAKNITIINIQGVSTIADYFIIASGENFNQVQAMADNAKKEMEKSGYECRQIEGYQTANWILMDYNDLIVHIFNNEDRLFYDLERIWRDGKTVTIEEIETIEPEK